jgi:ammonium transporter
MTHAPLDIAWVLLCAALVMLMQAGFCCLESGLVRSKNSINVAFKNFVDFLLSSALFWVFGFALMFGASQNGLIGTTGFFFDGEGTPWLLAFFIFQMMFCGTATTIISGAVAERMRFSGYLIVATIVAGLIYPVIGHWAWGGAESGTASGWLAAIGFIDFAGTTVVHSVGGWVSLAAIIIIGPRLGRFDHANATIHGHDLPLVTLGVFLLWFGWFGFNGGSTFGLTDEVPGILINTTISGAFGGLAALALSWRVHGRPDVGIIMNGALAGLVGITGSAHIMTTVAAMGIGLIAGVVMFAGTLLLERLKLDDVVGAFPVHGCGGVWGTLAIPLFGNPETWGTGLGRWDQFLAQAAGVGACFLWAFCLGFALLWLINRVHPLRIDPDGERIGLNVAEHGASTEILDLLNEMDQQRQSNDFSQHVSVEPHTEIGQIAHQYNRVLDGINAETRRREAAMSALERKTASLDLLRRISAAANRASEIEEAMQTCVDEVCSYMDWPVGHVYMLEEGGSMQLAPTDIWHIEDPQRFRRFRDATTGTRFGPGMGLVGRVLESGKPSWMSDVSSDPGFLRAESAKESGLRAGFAFPVLVGEDVVAVLDFFSDEAAEPDETTLDLMASIGTQLGRVVERKRNEEHRFKAIVDNVPVLLFLRDLSGRFILVNDGYRDFYNLHDVDIRGKTLPDIFEGSDFAKEALKAADLDRTVIEQDRIEEQELTAEFRGETRYMATLRFPIHDMDGHVTAVGGVEIDLTERKRAEQALSRANAAKDAALRELGESEQRYALAVEGANDGLWDWNLVSGEIYVSPRAKRIMGLETEDEVLTTEAWNSRVHPEDIERVKESERAHLDGEADFYSCEYRVLGADGRYEWVLDRGTCLRDGQGRPYRMAGSLGDITQRKRGEQFLRSVVNTIPGALNIRDQEGRFVLSNQTLADYYGIDSKEAIGKLSEEIIPKTTMDEQEEAEIRQVMESGEPIIDSEYEYERDGEKEYWLTTRQPINDPVGQLQYVLTVAYEITELRRAEQAMRESQQFLGTLVDNIPAAVFFRDLDGRYIRVNRRYAEMFQVTDESVRGKTVYDFFPKDRADEFTAYDREAIEQRRVLNREEKFVLQGEECIFDELNFPILNASGEVIAVGGVDVDITNLKEAQEALRQSQERLVQALESISEAFALCDADDRLVLFNSRYRRMFFPLHEDFVQEGETF